jgi:RNA polymerase sigma-70 factor (ECF subfamily)
MENVMRAVSSKVKMETANPREFIRLLMENERRIYAYVLTLLGNNADAEDVLQETSMTLWDKFSEFDQVDGNFIAWSFKIAYFTAQNHRRKQCRSRVHFSDSLVESISNRSTKIVSVLDQRRELLAVCIEKLSDGERRLLQLRYEVGASVESAAADSGKSVQAIYKALSRLRTALFECVNRGMAIEEQA